MNNLDKIIVSPRLDGLYEVAQDLTINLPNGCTLDIAQGFTYDGASIPRLLWRVCGSPYEAPRCVAALAHDWFYAAQVISRAESDKIYRDLQISYGISTFRANCEYRALRMFGWIAWNSKSNDDIVNARFRGILNPKSEEVKNENT